jgi:DNA-binding MarR family transcriptional regulator
MPAKKRDENTARFRLSEFLPYKLAVVTDHISRTFAECYQGSYNLTLAEWRMLATVAEYGKISPTAAGQYTAMDKVKVSRAAQGLAAKGLLRQTRDPRDGRGRLLHLTRKGAATFAGVVPLAAKVEASLFRDLSQADLVALNRVLMKIATGLEMTNGSRPGE